MPLWPFCPAPVITETLQWDTAGTEPYSTQQRAALALAPRQGAACEYILDFRQYERAQLLMEYAAAGDWEMPVWWERARVTVGSGGFSIPVDTTAADYRPDGKVLLWQSSELCEALTIDAIAPGTITTTTPITGSYVGGFVAPIRENARALAGLSAARTIQRRQVCGVEWMVYEGADLADAGLYGTYRGHPIITESPRIGAGSLEAGVSRDQETVDAGVGLAYFDAQRGFVQRPLGAAWMVNNAADLWALRGFLHALKGRRAGFWLPAWTRGIDLAAAIGPADGSISIRAVGFSSYASAGDLMLQTEARAQHYLRFTAAAPAGANETLTLSAPAGITVDPAAVRRISRLHFCRAAADTVQIRHEHLGKRQLSTVQLAALEAPVPP